MRRVLLLALLVLAALPTAAHAHAVVKTTSPQRGAALHRAPATVSFAFNEGVEAAFGAVRVYGRDGERVDDGRVTHPGGDAKQVAVGLRGALPDGGYTATFRVVSADGHPVAGGFTFAVGHAPVAAGTSVKDLLAGSSVGPATEVAFSATRTIGYLAMAVAVGGLIFLVACWLPALSAAAGAQERWRLASHRFDARWRRVWWVAAATGIVTAALGLVLQAATAGGTSFWVALDPSVVGEVLQTRAGRGWLARLVLWLALTGAVSLLAQRRGAAPGLRRVALGADGVAVARPSHSTLGVVGALALLLVASPAFAGHAAVQSPVALLLPLDILHVAAMCVWLGGLVALLAVVPGATRCVEPAERARLLAPALERFSALALASVIALAATGVGQAIVHVERFGALLDTAFGRSVLTKVGLLALVIALGAVNRSRSVPRLRAAAERGEAPGGAGRLLRRTLRAEVVLVVAVLAVTGALVSYPPPSSPATGPVSRDVALGPNDLQLTVDPAQSGANQVHLYLLAPDGAPFDGSKEVRLTATLPKERIGPIDLDLRKAGPGHYVATGAALAPAGTWTLTVDDRVSNFDQYRANLQVPVR